MLTEFTGYIQQYSLFEKHHKILLTVSGGMDSSVLADLFHKAGYTFAIAHCNFCLRGEESDGDEDFVQKLAKKYKVPFYCEKFETTAFAAQEKVSIQMAARALRYAWFEKLALTHSFDFIATAHHKNDILETLILNFTKGTGISGLHGIRPKNGKIVRPLLFADKEQIRDYIASGFLGWREDSSNENNKYQRNLVRNEVVPLLKKINPNLEETILQTVEKVSVVEDVFYKQVDTLRQEAFSSANDNIFLQINALKDKPVLFLFELLKEYNFSYPETIQIHNVLDEQPGKQFISITHTLVKDREQLVIIPKNLSAFGSVELADNQESLDEGGLKIKAAKFPNTNQKPPAQAHIATLDYEKLRFPLKIRRWKEGDWFIPLGMSGKKKLSDFLIDKKVPLNLKDEVKVMTSGDSIVWVLGMRIDDRFKVSEKTTMVYQLTARY